MRSSGCRSGRGRASTTTASLPALRRHYRVSPQWLVVGSRAGPVGVVGGMRGARAPATRAGAAAHLVAALGLRGGVRDACPRVGDRSELRALGLGDQIVRAGVASGARCHRSGLGLTTLPGGGGACARLRANCVDRAPGGARAARCLASGRTAEAGRQRCRRWPKPRAAFARPSGRQTERGRHPGVEARIREGGSRGCLPGGHRPRSGAPRKTRSGTSDNAFLGFVPFRRIQHGRS